MPPLRQLIAHLGFDPDAGLRPSKTVRGAILVACAFVIFAEFFWDLRADATMRVAVSVVDLLLVVGFAGFVGFRAALSTDKRSFFVEHRIDILLLAVSIIVAVMAPRAGAIGVILRIAIFETRELLDRTLLGRASALLRLRPSQALAVSFAALIAMGSFLLLLPAATQNGAGLSLTDAAFTIASATSVTGLVVVDTGSTFSTFGLVVILVTIQIGAIGIMVLAAAFAVLVGGRVASSSRETLTEAGFGEMVDVGTAVGLRRLVFSVTFMTLAIELIGALALYACWITNIMELDAAYDTPLAALWWCAFTAISAFTHAGFSLDASNAMRFVSNVPVNIVVVWLIFVGSLGFPVIADLTTRRSLKNRGLRGLWRAFHLQTRVVLIASVVLAAVGTLAFLFFEFDGALAGLSIPTKVMSSFFHSMSARSAGFNTVSLNDLTTPTVIVFVILFFIGSAPGSTGGGVRVTTFAVVVMSVRAMLRGRDDVELLGRTLPKVIVYRSIAIVLVAGAILAVLLVLMTATQSLPFEKLLFETFSAFGTVGLSMGITGELDGIGRWILTIAMYFGRVGPLTLALAVAERQTSRAYRYPEGRVAVG